MENDRDRERLLLNQKQAHYFDQTVELFDQEQPPRILQHLEQIVEEAHIQAGEVVLDVGAGVGVLTPLIRARQAGRILACELSEGMLSRLKPKYPDVETHLGDISDLSLPEASLDVIFMNAVFPNIVDKGAALGNCTRMLRVGGRLVIGHPEGRAFVERIREIVPFPLDPLPTFPQLRQALQAFPLKVVRYVDRKDLYIAVVRRVRGTV